MNQENLDSAPLFGGLTRPAMILGIELKAFIGIALMSAFAFLFTNNPFVLLIGFPPWLVLRLMSIKEPRILSLWLQSLKFRQAHRNSRHWKAASYAPLDDQNE